MKNDQITFGSAVFGAYRLLDANGFRAIGGRPAMHGNGLQDFGQARKLNKSNMCLRHPLQLKPRHQRPPRVKTISMPPAAGCIRTLDTSGGRDSGIRTDRIGFLFRPTMFGRHVDTSSWTAIGTIHSVAGACCLPRSISQVAFTRAQPMPIGRAL